MREVAPGIHHWTAFHDGIRSRVSSYYVEPERVLIDPMVPEEEGLDWFESQAAPEQILLTNRHHFRHSDRFVARFGCMVRCSEPGLHEFEGTDRDVRGFAFGERVTPHITAVEIDAICPDETALHIELGAGAVALADGAVRGDGGPLRFVNDSLLGDDPDAVKAGLRAAYARLAERDFEHVLLAHGEPLVADGKRMLLELARDVAAL